MNRDELIKLAIYQRERMEEMEAARKESDRKNAELTGRISELTELLRKSNEAMSTMAGQMSELIRQLKAEREESAKLRSEVKVGRRHLFDRKSQKGTRNKDDENRPTPHTDVKGDFDGTPESLPGNLDVDMVDETTNVAGESTFFQKEGRLYRLGNTYRTMAAENHVFHKSDMGKLPEGAIVTKTYSRYVFLYRKDGDYTIDNSLAERCIRPLANERKNSLFFGSDKMARVSAAYHSIVSTCKLQGYSILEYLKKFFAEIVAGNRDYGKLMPSTIGISANKL